jgi:hypothetical protein
LKECREGVRGFPLVEPGDSLAARIDGDRAD